MLFLKSVLLPFLFLGLAPQTTTADLLVIIKGFPSNQGTAFVAIYRKTDAFPVFGKQYIGKAIAIKNNEARIIFTGLSTGSYAVAVYHDINNNKVLDKNYLGIPTESYGFSNNARRTFSAPSFSEAAVVVNTSKTINITVK